MVLRGSHQCAGWQQSFLPNNLTEDPDVEESLQRGDRAKGTDEGKLRYPAMNRSKPLPPREKKTGGGMCPESREIQGLAGGPPGGTVTGRDVTPARQMWYQSRKDEQDQPDLCFHRASSGDVTTSHQVTA